MIPVLNDVEIFLLYILDTVASNGRILDTFSRKKGHTNSASFGNLVEGQVSSVDGQERNH